MIYLTFVGTHDQPEFYTNGFGSALTIFFRYKDEIDQVFILVTPATEKVDFPDIASKIKQIMELENSKVKIELIDVDLPNPIDYNLVYQVMFDETQKLMKNKKIREDEKIINITSGSPTMTACWVLLQKSGLIPNAKLFQSFEKKYQRQRGKTCQKVNLELDNFPEITIPEDIKRELNRTKIELQAVKDEISVLDLDAQFPNLIGTSESMRFVKREIIRLAPTNVNILILGETGTGKELVASYLVEKSQRYDKPFRTVNLGDKETTLIESELFGHNKGAFTGAHTDRDGLFKSCDGGTVFLDEIGDLPKAIQTRILRVMETGDYTPLGSDEEIKTNVRIIAATNADIDKLMKGEKFRKDFIMRFGSTIEIEPLSSRPDDISLLIEHFKKRLDTEVRFSEQCIESLKREPWPGNVRQLFVVVQQAATVIKDTPLERSDIPLSAFRFMHTPPTLLPDLPLPDDTTIDEVLKNIEFNFYDRALQRHEYNAEKAAQEDLHIQPHTFRKRLKTRN